MAGRAAYCGHEDVALQLLASAIDGHYLAGPALDTDPMLARIRPNPEFAHIRARAFQKQKAYEAYRHPQGR